MSRSNYLLIWWFICVFGVLAIGAVSEGTILILWALVPGVALFVVSELLRRENEREDPR